LRYRGFNQQGFRIAAAFDVDAEKVGKTVEGIEIFYLDDLAEVVAAKGIRLAIIAVPGSVAQAVADSLVAAGIEGVLNFAPATLALPDRVSRVGVDLAIELEQLSFAVVNRPENP
jgi:redox-sensing transcriptional repressor